MDIWLAILLISFGLIFLVLEIFVFPGIGISGIIGLISLGIGVYISFRLSTNLGVIMLTSSLVGTSILVYLSVKLDVFSKFSLAKNIDSKVDVNYFSELSLDDEGITISRLAPMGKARFGSKYLEVSSFEGFIEENTPIKISKLSDHTIFVSSLKSK